MAIIAARTLVVRLWRSLPVGIVLVLGMHAGRVQADPCALLGPCADGTNDRGRAPYLNQKWDLYSVPSSIYIKFTESDYENMVQAVFTSYADLGPALPRDWLNTDQFNQTSEFRWGWVTRNDILNLTERRSGITAAGTSSRLGGPTYPCQIISTIVMFAYNPGDGQSNYCWTPDACAPSCYNFDCGTDNLDYSAAAEHEYGHAMGLAHTTYAGATMNPQIAPGDTSARTLLQCEKLFLQERYSDNFGPAVIDSFVAHPAPVGQVACTWSALKEKACRKYRVLRLCPDGTVTVVADSVQCAGSGIVHTVVDVPLCTGDVRYELALVDTVAAGITREVVVAVSGCRVGGALVTSRVQTPTLALTASQPGFASPEDAVRALGVAVTARQSMQEQRTLADGFSYFTVAGEFWGRSIDRILEGQIRACLASSDTTIDSIAFVPQGTTQLDDQSVRVTAAVHYIHRCRLDTDWAGQVAVLVERRRAEDGWRIRQMVEKW